jgi:hypothetical protein
MSGINCPRCGAFKSTAKELCNECEYFENVKKERDSLRERVAIIEPLGFDKENVEVQVEPSTLVCNFPTAVKKVKALLALGIEGIRIVVRKD